MDQYWSMSRQFTAIGSRCAQSRSRGNLHSCTKKLSLQHFLTTNKPSVSGPTSNANPHQSYQAQNRLQKSAIILHQNSGSHTFNSKKILPCKRLKWCALRLSEARIQAQNHNPDEKKLNTTSVRTFTSGTTSWEGP